MRVVQSPEEPQLHPTDRAVFVAGSIDMGSTRDWQRELVDSLAACNGVLLNPRRPHWDPTWPADADFPIFRRQVDWELRAMESAGLIAFYFAPSSKAPITLMELGLAARTGKAIVCCPPGYWRKGNVDIVCQHYQVPMVSSLEELAESIRLFVGGR